jgi:hypothetical protein
MWILSLLNPASAFVRACKAIIDIITFFIQRGSQIVELVNAVIESVTAIANGAVGGAAKAIENAMSKALPVIIGFMASLLGLGGITGKIQDIIKRVRQPIEKAIDWVIAQAVKFAKKIGNKLGFGKGKEKTENKQEPSAEYRKKAQNKVKHEVMNLKQKGVSWEGIEAHFPKWKSQFGFKTLNLKVNEKLQWVISGSMSPEEEFIWRDPEDNEFFGYAEIEDGYITMVLDLVKYNENGEMIKRSKMRGRALIQAIIDHFKKNPNFKGVRGAWTYGDNLKVVNELVSQNVPLEEAVKRTPTGLSAIGFGFPNPRIVRKLQGPDGKYTKLEVLFDP